MLGLFSSSFSDCRGLIEEGLKLLPFDHTFHPNLDGKPQVIVVCNHAPQFLFANTEIGSRLGDGQGILFTNSYVVTFFITHFHFNQSLFLQTKNVAVKSNNAGFTTTLGNEIAATNTVAIYQNRHGCQ